MMAVKETLTVIANTELVKSVEGRLTKQYLEKIKETVNAEANPIIYLSIDPGKTNGICGYDAKFYLMFM